MPADHAEDRSGRPASEMAGLPRAGGREIVVALGAFAESGSEASFHDLVGLLGAELLPYLQRRIGRGIHRRVDALDVFQEICLRLFGMRDRIEDRGDRAAWALIYKIARHELLRIAREHRAGARDVGRERSRTAGPGDTSTSPRESPGPHTAPPERALREERALIVQTCLERLPPKDRELITLLDYEQISCAAAAERLGVSVDTVRVRHYRAMQRLRKQVTRLLSGP